MDFRDHITNAVGQCNVLLVVIGNSWLDARNPNGSRRLDESTDFVRLEVEAALARGIPVIPVLVDKAVVPPAGELPPSLQRLVYRNAAELRAGRDFDPHLERLIQRLSPLIDSAQPTPPQPLAKQAAVLTRPDVSDWVAKEDS